MLANTLRLRGSSLLRTSRPVQLGFISSSSSTAQPKFGIAFDIDGVLIRGGKQLPRAHRVLQSLRENNVPHIFLTNGGGCMEDDKAANLSNILDLQIDPKHMVLSHTPMREIASIYGDKRVLIMGSRDVYTVAKQYGFKKVVSVKDFTHHHPTQYPFHKYEHKPAPFHGEPVDAIIIMHDPIDWAPEIQVAVDVLIGGTALKLLPSYHTVLEVVNLTFECDPPGSGRPCGTQTPLFVSNDDFVFSGAYPFPRFAQGAFTKCLTLLYEERTGKKLEVTRYGKPHNVTYNYAENLLNQILGCDASNKLTSIYGIGDNPHADIQGANNAGAHWSSILVKTGIFDGSTDPEHVPDVISDCVFEAIKHIYEREGLDASSLEA